MKRKATSDYIFFIEAWILLTLSKCLILLFPFKKIAKLIGNVQTETVREVMNNPAIMLVELSIIRAKRYLFFSSKCYDQALAVTFMLKRRGIASTLYFGLNKLDQELAAHAWVRCGDKIVAGRLGYEKFTPVAWFSSPK